MNILIAAIHWPVASGKYCAEALRRMGRDVCSTGPYMGTRIWGVEVDERYVWKPQRPADGWTPDLVLIMDSEVELSQRLADCPHVVYGVDNHVRDYRQFNRIADHFFLGHGHGQRIGEDNVTWLPCGYDNATFTPGPAWSKRAVDAAIVAVPYPNRQSLLFAMLANVPNISINYGTGLVYDEYAAAYQNARLSLVASARDDVAQRVWETAAMGCLVLKDANSDDEALGLVHNENCLIYHSVEEAVELAQWALDNPDDAEAIAQAGQKWAQTGTWEQRLQVILDWATAQKPKKRSATRDSSDS